MRRSFLIVPLALAIIGMFTFSTVQAEDKKQDSEKAEKEKTEKAAPIPQTSGAAAPSAEGKQRLVVHLSRGTHDLHATLMALELANALQKGGAQVTLFLDLDAVRIADSRNPIDLRFGRAVETPDSLYGAFTQAGGRVVLCAHCAAVAGIEQASLRSGATLAHAEDLVSIFLEADKIIDY